MKPWGRSGKGPAEPMKVAVRDQVAIPVMALPLDDYARLTLLGTARPGGQALSANTRRAYAYAIRYYRGAQLRRRPELLAMTLGDSVNLADGLEVYRVDMVARKAAAQAIVELEKFASAVKALGLALDPARFGAVAAKLRAQAAADGPDIKPGHAPLSLPEDRLAPRDRDRLVAMMITPPGRIASRHLMQAARAAEVIKRFLGALARHDPLRLDAPDAERFGRDGIAIYARDVHNPANPGATLGKLRQLRHAVALFDRERDTTAILAEIQAWRKRLIETGALQAPPTVAAGLPVNQIPPADLERFEAAHADNDDAGDAFVKRLEAEGLGARYSAKGRKIVWKRALRRSTRAINLHLLRSLLGSRQRHEPDLFARATLLDLDRAIVERYIADLECSCADRTIVERLERLRLLYFRLGTPLAHLDWLADIARDRREQLRARPIWRSVLRPKEIFKAAIAAYADARARLALQVASGAYQVCDPGRLAIRLRDCLIIAFQVFLMLRRRNLAGIVWKTHMARGRSGLYQIRFDGSETKTGLGHKMNVPRVLTEAFDYYIDHVRGILHPKPEASALWVSSRTGAALTASGIEKIVSSAMEDILGIAIANHRFRNIGLSAAAALRHIMDQLPMRLAGHAAAAVSERYYIAMDPRATNLAAATDAEIGKIIDDRIKARGLDLRSRGQGVASSSR